MRNPFRTPGIPGLNQNSLEDSPRALATPEMAPIPSITRPERPINPEMKRERFKKLQALLGSVKKPAGVVSKPASVLPPMGPKMPKF